MGTHHSSVVAGYIEGRITGVVAATLELIKSTDFSTGRAFPTVI